jgi:hypothetical protein
MPLFMIVDYRVRPHVSADVVHISYAHKLSAYSTLSHPAMGEVDNGNNIRKPSAFDTVLSLFFTENRPSFDSF